MKRESLDQFSLSAASSFGRKPDRLVSWSDICTAVVNFMISLKCLASISTGSFKKECKIWLTLQHKFKIVIKFKAVKLTAVEVFTIFCSEMCGP